MDHVRCLAGVLKHPKFSVRSKFSIFAINSHVLQVPAATPAYSINLMWEKIEVRSLDCMLFDIKDDVESSLSNFRILKRLNVREMSSCLIVTLVFIRWPSCPYEIGFDRVDILFPAATLSFEVVHAEP